MSATRVCPDTAAAEPPVRLNRTCTNCRQRKVKCTPHGQEQLAGSVSTCTRCWKQSLSCIFPPAARKRTRRRNEDKIRDLESRLQAVQAAVESGLGLQSPPDGETTSCLSAVGGMPSQMSLAESVGAPSENTATDKLVNPELAEELCQTFIDHMAPLYPLVSLPGSSNWQSVQRDRPALFRAMTTAASTSLKPGISGRMFRDTAQFLADKVVVDGEKSLDLIQALLVLSTWHLPPDTYKELKFNQYAHMAAKMLTDLRCSTDSRYAIPTAGEPTPPSPELAEVCRTFLATYFLCSRYASGNFVGRGLFDVMMYLG